MEFVSIDTPTGPRAVSCSVALSSSNHSPLVLLHGLAANQTLFSGLTPALAQQRRSVLSLDWEGHGRTPLAEATASERPSISQYVDLLRSFLLYHHIDEDRPCVLVAHAEGAFIAVNFAAANPEYVAGLVLLSPVLPPSNPTTQNLIHLYKTLAMERTPAELAERLPKLLTSAQDGEELRMAVRAMMSEAIPSTTQGFTRMCQAMEHATEPDYTQVISIRSLIIGGTRDAHSPPAVLEALAVSLHGTQMSHLKDDVKTLFHFGKARLEEQRWERETRIVHLEAGHWLPLDKPGELAMLIDSFLTG